MSEGDDSDPTFSLTFENFAAMKFQKLFVRMQILPLRNQQSTITAQQPLDTLRRLASGKQQFVVVSDRNQSPIKHPMHGSGKRNSIANTVWPTLRDRPNMRSLSL